MPVEGLSLLLLYFPLLSQLFVLGLGKLDPPGMDSNHKLARGFPLQQALNLIKLHCTCLSSLRGLRHTELRMKPKPKVQLV